MPAHDPSSLEGGGEDEESQEEESRGGGVKRRRSQENENEEEQRWSYEHDDWSTVEEHLGSAGQALHDRARQSV